MKKREWNWGTVGTWAQALLTALVVCLTAALVWIAHAALQLEQQKYGDERRIVALAKERDEALARVHKHKLQMLKALRADDRGHASAMLACEIAVSTVRDEQEKKDWEKAEKQFEAENKRLDWKNLW